MRELMSNDEIRTSRNPKRGRRGNVPECTPKFHGFFRNPGHAEYAMAKQNGINLVAVIALGLAAITGPAQPNKIMAQKAVEEIKASHPEISGLEVAAIKSDTDGCKTIAATEASEV